MKIISEVQTKSGDFTFTVWRGFYLGFDSNANVPIWTRRCSLALEMEENAARQCVHQLELLGHSVRLVD